MTTSGTSAVNVAERLDRALAPYLGERSGFAYQLDLFYRLAVRMVLKEAGAAAVIQDSLERRRQLDTLLMVPHAVWVNAGDTSIDVKRLTSVAIPRLAPNLGAPHAPQDRLDRLFDELAQLLSSTERYYKRLDQLEWRERYQPIGRTFQEHDSLITHSKLRWEFLYDRSGRWLRAAGQSHKVPYGGPDWKRNAALIHDVSSAVRKIAAAGRPPTARVDLDLTVLSTELRILPSAPSWVATEPALNRLKEYEKGRTIYPELNNDIAKVGTYAKMLAVEQRTLTNALFCGTVVGRFAASPAGDPVLTGLRTISQAYRYDDESRSGPAVPEALAALADVIVKRWPMLRDLWEGLSDRLKAQDYEKWGEMLGALPGHVSQAVPFGVDDGRVMVERAWEDWQKFLQPGFVEMTHTPGLDDLLCRARAIGPSAVLRDRPRDMSLVEWSTAYYRSLVQTSPDSPEFAPPWLAPIVAAVLGPLDPASSGFSPGRLVAPPASGLVVYEVDGAAGAHVKKWRIQPDYAAVAWTPTQAMSVFERAIAAGGSVQGWPELHHVFIDGTVDAAKATQLLTSIERAVPSGNKRLVTAFSFDRSATQPAWAERLILEPEDSTALTRTATARPLHDVDDLSPSLKRIWQDGSRLVGEIADGQSVEVEVRPSLRDIELRWSANNRLYTVRLSLSAIGLQQTSPFVERLHNVSYDGVTIRAEQHDIWIRRLAKWIGRPLARAYVSSQSFELTENKNGWTVEITSRDAAGRSRRLTLRLTDTSRITASSRAL